MRLFQTTRVPLAAALVSWGGKQFLPPDLRHHPLQVLPQYRPIIALRLRLVRPALRLIKLAIKKRHH
jgi:hypothetical protein